MKNKLILYLTEKRHKRRTIFTHGHHCPVAIYSCYSLAFYIHLHIYSFIVYNIFPFNGEKKTVVGTFLYKNAK